MFGYVVLLGHLFNLLLCLDYLECRLCKLFISPSLEGSVESEFAESSHHFLGHLILFSLVVFFPSKPVYLCERFLHEQLINAIDHKIAPLLMPSMHIAPSPKNVTNF